MGGVKRRIYGLETEYGLTCVSHSTRAMSSEEAARVLFRPITSEHHASNVFLTNGSRLYLDVGAHPEYATAECDDLLQLLVHDRAGEEVMADLARRGTQALRAGGVDAELVMLKNNTDSHGNSYGCHENYLVGRVGDYAAFTEALLGFLVSRQLVCGAGRVVRDADGTARYSVSQRAEHMLDAVSSATTRSRPMINTRDEPHGDPRRHRRMHVIVGDSNLAEASTLLKVGTTELVIRVLEEDPDAFAALALADPIAAIKAVSRDLRGGGLVELADGRTITGLELQEAYFARCAELDEFPPTLDRVMGLWRDALDALAADRLDALAGHVDWVIKLRWLQRYLDRHSLPLGSPAVAALDLRYHEITGGGIARLLEQRGAVARITDPADVARAVEVPPATTRAALRGRFVAAATEHGRDFEVDWVTLHCKDLADGMVRCPDPFAASDERVDALIERMAREPRAGLGFRFADPPLPC